MLQKVKFFNKRWQICLQFCQSNLIGFSHVKLVEFTTALPLGHFFKDFFLLLELHTKDSFCHKKGRHHKW